MRKSRPRSPIPPGATARPVISRITEPAPDAELIDAIADASFTDYGFSVEEELSRPWSRIWIARRCEPGPNEGPPSSSRRGLAEADHEMPSTSAPWTPVGFLVSWHVADEVHILNIATLPRVRRQGVGMALMAEALDYAARHQVRLVLLEVRRSNRAAIRLYRKFGFTAMGVRPGYYSDNGEDAIEMVLTLDPLTGAFLRGRDEIRIDV